MSRDARGNEDVSLHFELGQFGEVSQEASGNSAGIHRSEGPECRVVRSPCRLRHRLVVASLWRSDVLVKTGEKRRGATLGVLPAFR
jgi:hypothetical protein